MLNKSNWKAWVVLAVAVAMFITSGGLLMASNVGFKINKALKNNFLAPGPQGDNWVSLPYNSPYTTWTLLCNAFTAAAAGKNNFTLSQLNSSTGVFTNVQCTLPPAGSPLNTQGLRVRVLPLAGAVTSAVLVGSSNEATPLPTIFGGFQAPGPKGDNWLSYPYHTTWAKANDVCVSLGLGLTQGTVSRIDANSGIFTNFQCGSGTGSATNFSLVIGESVRVRKNNAGNIVALLPPHF